LTALTQLYSFTSLLFRKLAFLDSTKKPSEVVVILAFTAVKQARQNIRYRFIMQRY